MQMHNKYVYYLFLYGLFARCIYKVKLSYYINQYPIQATVTYLKGVRR